MAAFSLFAGGLLVVLTGAGCALGAIVLFRGGAQKWPNVIANAGVLRRTAVGLLVMALALLVTGAAAILRMPWGVHAAGTALCVFVAGGFWGNHAVFGDFRPMHTGSNVVIAAVAIVLLWIGYPALVAVQ